MSISLRIPLASAANMSARALKDAHCAGFTHSTPFQVSPAWHLLIGVQPLPFQDSFGWQLVAVFTAAGAAVQVPFFPMDCPAGHSPHLPFVQIRRRRLPSVGSGLGSLQEPSGQIRRRRSESGALGFSLVEVTSVEVTSPTRGEPMILLSPDVGKCGGDAVLFTLESEDEVEAWLAGALGVGLGVGGVEWLAGILTGAGLLAALVCVGLGAGAGAGAGAGGAATGAGGGLGGVEVVVECCANTEDANNKLIATTRLESRMTHLRSTANK